MWLRLVSAHAQHKRSILMMCPRLRSVTVQKRIPIGGWAEPKPPERYWFNKMKGYVYILECSNGQYYTGSTTDLEKRLAEHQCGKGANFTKKNLPVKLVYFEKYERIDEAFNREKQIQGWSQKKKEALIKGEFDELNKLAECKNETHYRWFRLRSTTD